MAGEEQSNESLKTKNEILQKAVELQNEVNASQSTYNNISEKTNELLGGFANAANKAGFSLQNLGSFASKQSGAFTVLGTQIISARDAFKGFSNIGQESGAVSTFHSRLSELGSMLGMGGAAANKAQKEIEKLKPAFLAAGGTADQWIKGLAAGPKVILGMIDNLTSFADRAIVGEASMLRFAASTGRMGEVMGRIGPHMESLNDLYAEQEMHLNLAGGAANKTREQIDAFHGSMAKIPGVLHQMVNANAAGTEKMSMLVASIKLADGTMRDHKDIVEDLYESYKQYGVEGENAARFTSRFSEISEKYGLELEDVRAGLKGATAAFKDMTNAGDASAKMQENAAKFMDAYVQRLKDAGMTGKHAIETVQGVTSAMGALNIAQKAFLSSQTGGPGGLMGGFQIEKMIQQGDTEGLQKKMMQVMQRQFGKIVTLDEATKSQAAAAQLEKQTMLLRQGPMGQLVKSDQDAYKFLDAMKAQQEGRAYKDPTIKGAGLDPTGLQKNIERGSVWEEKTHTVISDVASDVSSIRSVLEHSSLNMVQKAVTGAHLAGQQSLTEDQLKMRANLEARSKDATKKSGEMAEHAKTDTSKRIISDRTEQIINDSVNNLVDSGKNAVTVIKSVVDTGSQGFKKMMTGSEHGPEPTPNYKAMIDQKRQAQTSASAPAPTPPAQQVRDATGKVLPAFLQNMGPAPSPGARVAAATRAPAPPRETAGPLTQNLGAPKAPQPNVTVEKQGETGRINVKVIVTEEPASTNADAIAKAGSISP